ncbi:hypothetical protein MMH89_02810 [Candidatus Comchoanobacter bicostacola]|uniref:Uncharacterized protein n=1 Tax=Candidatus Comchoanobacter bicostacola TaxID=2919598 RepID=A0ABY5DKA4_9GAMM|nr:hypothetical protein [Candidatus Comchoanobacter bicostacola]UTC24154.1 hypothetical protein MMH89_02810 [Candidatus Comchoanobacter bicostacola]
MTYFSNSRGDQTYKSLAFSRWLVILALLGSFYRALYNLTSVVHLAFPLPAILVCTVIGMLVVRSNTFNWNNYLKGRANRSYSIVDALLTGVCAFVGFASVSASTIMATYALLMLAGVGVGLYALIAKRKESPKVLSKTNIVPERTGSSSSVFKSIVSAPVNKLFGAKMLANLEAIKPVADDEKELAVNQRILAQRMSGAVAESAKTRGLEVSNWRVALDAWSKFLNQGSSSVQSKCGECPCSPKSVHGQTESKAMEDFRGMLGKLSVRDWSQFSLEALNVFSDVLRPLDSTFEGPFSQNIADAKKLFSTGSPKLVGVYLKDGVSAPVVRRPGIEGEGRSWDLFLKCDQLNQEQKHGVVAYQAIRSELYANGMLPAAGTLVESLPK